MKQLLFLLLLVLQPAIISAQQFRNPIIPGYHPDPSVCRVGDRFLLVNSSFQYFPGVPIYESEDLVHWQQIGNVLNRKSQLDLTGASSWTGIYAPTIRYDNGIYYMVTTNVGNGGNFLVTARDPQGPWSDPVKIGEGAIDPSLYFENGHCYYCSNPNGTIALCEIDPKTGKILTPFKPVWSGTGGRYVEGPHIYKKDGYYYLLCSEGGTELAHSLTIARSRNIFGPYESNPANPIMTNCRANGQDKQIQGTGHGDFVQAMDGSWWIVFLAYRNMGGSYHHLGRETCLAPVDWSEGDWPVIYGGEAIDTLMRAKLPPQHLYPAKSMTFTKDSPSWIYLQNPDSSKYQWMISKQVGRPSDATVLRLYGSESSLTQNNKPTYIGRRQEAEHITCEVRVDLHQQTNIEAGVSVYQISDGHYDLFVEHNKKTGTVVGLRYQVKGLPMTPILCKADQKNHTTAQPVFLRVQSTENQYVFSYSFDGKEYQTISALPSTMLSTEVVGGFTGVTLGMYAHGKGYADFTKWKYEEN